VGERKKEEHVRARLSSPSRAQAWASGEGRVNGSPKSGPILAGTWLPFADLFCHFESVTDLMRGILGLVTDLVFGTPKTLAVPPYKYARVPVRNMKNRRRTTRLDLPAALPRTLLHPVHWRV
jgi:hypothetical protein